MSEIKNTMGKAERIERYKKASVKNWSEKVLALAALESSIEAQMRTFCELHNIKILDVQLYDPRTCDIQFETDL